MYLKHKNQTVAKLTMYQNQPIGIEEIFTPERMPVGLRGNIDFADRNFLAWNGQRVIPDGRVNIDIIKERLGATTELSAKSLGLSLTDCYWFCPNELTSMVYKSLGGLYENDGTLAWEKINFTDNGFISDLLLLKQGCLDIPHRTPDYTTGGVLDKFWFCQNGRSYLAKMGTIPGVQDEPVLAANEVIVSKIAAKMNIPCVEYTPIRVGNEIGCVSECFSSRDEDVVTAQSIAYQMDTYDCERVMDYLCAIGFGEDIDKMIVLHTLIGNHDAHLSNFALGMDANSGEYTRFIPLYDNGSSLGWNKVPYHDMEMKPLNRNPQEYIRYANTYIQLPKLDELTKCVMNVYKEYEISGKQTEIAVQTLTDGYETVQERMIELERDGLEFEH